MQRLENFKVIFLLLSKYRWADTCVKNELKKELVWGSCKPENRKDMLGFSLSTDNYHPACRTVHKQTH